MLNELLSILPIDSLKDLLKKITISNHNRPMYYNNHLYMDL